MLLRTLTALAIALAVCAVASRAVAAGGDTTIHLDYAVAPDCPDEEAFIRDVRARAEHFTPSDAATSPAWSVTARREADANADGPFTGRIAMRDDAGRETVRDVSGATCREVIAALALIGALTIDAQSPPPAPSLAPSPSPPPSPPPLRSWQLGIAARAGLHAGLAPDPVAALGGLVELRARAPGWWSPAASLGFARTFASSTALAGSGSADFVVTMGTLDLCPSRGTVSRFSFSGCLCGELGVLSGQGSTIEPPKEQARVWAAVDGVARAELALLSSLSLAITAGLRVPLVRTRFFFQPDATVFRPAAVGSLAGVELVVRFL